MVRASNILWATLVLTTGACGDNTSGNGEGGETSQGSGTGNGTSGDGSTDDGTTDGRTTDSGTTDDNDPGTGGQGDPGDGDTGGGGTGTGGDGDDSDGNGSDGGDGIRFDIGGGADSTGGSEGGDGAGCKKVDFLFVVDNSGSMGDEQQNLVQSFPNFIQTIESTIETEDFHIMVVDTDAEGRFDAPIEDCDRKCANAEVESCDFRRLGLGIIPCADRPPVPEPCDKILGAGRNDAAPDSLFALSGFPCPIDGPQRYIRGGQTDLAETFECLGLVGTYGNGGEKPMEAMVDAVSPPLAAAGGCNEGFLRDDAVLVVTVITDESDVGKSIGDPTSWYQAVVQAKRGNSAGIVALGLIGDTGQAGSVCMPANPLNGDGAQDAPRIRQFVESFGPLGVEGSVCADDYGPFFERAVSVIETACDEFVPVG